VGLSGNVNKNKCKKILSLGQAHGPAGQPPGVPSYNIAVKVEQEGFFFNGHPKCERVTTTVGKCSVLRSGERLLKITFKIRRGRWDLQELQYI